MADPDVTKLLARHEPQLARFCARYRDDPHDRDELAQLVRIRVWRGISTFDGRAGFTSWLYQIVRNTAATEYARHARHPLPIGSVPDGVGPSAVEEAVVTCDLVERALQRVDDRLRIAVELVDRWGCPQAEAARIAGVPEPTLRTRLFRGRRCARALLTDSDA